MPVDYDNLKRGAGDDLGAGALVSVPKKSRTELIALANDGRSRALLEAVSFCFVYAWFLDLVVDCWFAYLIGRVHHEAPVFRRQ